MTTELDQLKKTYKRLQNSHPIGFDNTHAHIFHPIKGLVNFEIDKIYQENNAYYVATKNQYLIVINHKMMLSTTSYYVKQQQEVFIKDFLPCSKTYIGIYNIGTNYFVLFGNQKVGSILKVEKTTIFFEFKEKFYQIQATPQTTIPIIIPQKENETPNITFDKDDNIGLTDKSGFTIFHTSYRRFTEQGKEYVEVERQIYPLYKKMKINKCITIYYEQYSSITFFLGSFLPIINSPKFN